MILIYNLFIQIYACLIKIASLWNPKAKAWIEGRKKFLMDLDLSQIKNKQIILFHCASVGEFEQAAPLLNLLKKRFPNYAYLISFFSPSGFNYVRKKYPHELIMYLPLDTKKNMVTWLASVKPDIVFVIKYEFWYHFLKQLHVNKTPVLLVSGIFRKNQWMFTWGKKFSTQLFSFFTHFFLQDDQSEKLLHELGFVNTKVVGDTRFDRVIQLSKEKKKDTILESFCTQGKTFMAGSIWPQDQGVLNNIIQALPEDWKIVLAPHEPQHVDLDWLTASFVKYSMGGGDAKILILDTLGVLAKAYQYASLTYVGGGFGKGIHNILEPAVYGSPILIGPNYHKFNEAVSLVAQQCAYEVSTNMDMKKWCQAVLFEPVQVERIKSKMEAYFHENTNVSGKIAVFLENEHRLFTS